MRSRRIVIQAVRKPMRAAARAASIPACPAPTTITSKFVKDRSVLQATSGEIAEIAVTQPHTYSMTDWKVQMFAYLRERHGDSVTVSAEPTVGSVLQALASTGVSIEACRIAIGDEFAHAQDAIPIGSELSLIPPVSGG